MAEADPLSIVSKLAEACADAEANVRSLRQDEQRLEAAIHELTLSLRQEQTESEFDIRTHKIKVQMKEDEVLENFRFIVGRGEKIKRLIQLRQREEEALGDEVTNTIVEQRQLETTLAALQDSSDSLDKRNEQNFRRGNRMIAKKLHKEAKEIAKIHQKFLSMKREVKKTGIYYTQLQEKLSFWKGTLIERNKEINELKEPLLTEEESVKNERAHDSGEWSSKLEQVLSKRKELQEILDQEKTKLNELAEAEIEAVAELTKAIERKHVSMNSVEVQVRFSD